jgi:hypothetical protein
VHGEENAFLVDVRAILRRGDDTVRSTLSRNWITGQCSLTAVPAGEGYSLEINASGWKPVKIENIRLHAERMIPKSSKESMQCGNDTDVGPGSPSIDADVANDRSSPQIRAQRAGFAGQTP